MGTTDRFAAGARLGDYVIDRELGTAGDLYEGTHVVLPRQVRLELLSPRCAGLRPLAVRLMREACILEALRHPGVPRIYEVGVLPDQRPWVATELVEGEPLARALEHGPLSFVDVAMIARDVAEVLAHAHRRGVVHRNVTPSAILRGDGSRGFPLCVVGWGDARLDGSAAQDIYALGAVLYEALTGRLPDGTRQRPAGPALLATLVEDMLSADPSARPHAAEISASARKVIAELGAPRAADEEVVEEEVVLLVDLSRGTTRDPVTPPPQPRLRTRWTPPLGIAGQPVIKQRDAGTGTRIGILKPRS